MERQVKRFFFKLGHPGKKQTERYFSENMINFGFLRDNCDNYQAIRHIFGRYFEQLLFIFCEDF